MEASYQLAHDLATQRDLTGRWPACPGAAARDAGVLLGAATASTGEAATETPSIDGWGRPLAVVVSPDGRHCLVVSRGSDGVLERTLGGPTPRWETGRDIAFLDGRPFQFPEGFQESGLSRSAVRAAIAERREQVLETWHSDEMAGLRQAHETLLASRPPDHQ